MVWYKIVDIFITENLSDSDSENRCNCNFSMALTKFKP